jgi:predicted nucleotidyltransferase component of viral defense system
MLHKQTASPFLIEILTKLMEQPVLSNFRLAGGTGLSLQLGHRKSIDIDLFSDEEFNIDSLKRIIRKEFTKADIRTLSFGISFYIPYDTENRELKVDIMETDKFIRPVQNIEDIRLAHIEDIAAMKLEAITSRNTKKDFYDIAELLKTYTIKQLLSFYSEKYPYNDIRDVLENFSYFSEDCENDFNPDILNNTEWLSVKFLLKDTLRDFLNWQKKQNPRIK